MRLPLDFPRGQSHCGFVRFIKGIKGFVTNERAFFGFRLSDMLSHNMFGNERTNPETFSFLFKTTKL